MIKTIIRSTDNMVIVFDETGEQVQAYQGPYPEVKPRILRDAPPEARFGYFPNNGKELKIISREAW